MDNVETKHNLEVDYSAKALSGGTYRWTRVEPETQVTSFDLTSNTEAVFILPNKVYNLSKTALEFQVEIANDGTHQHFLRTGHLACIESIQLQTLDGQMLCDHRDVGYFTKLTMRPTNCIEEFETYPRHALEATSATTTYETGQFFAPARVPNENHYRVVNPDPARAVDDYKAAAALAASFYYDADCNRGTVIPSALNGQTVTYSANTTAPVQEFVRNEAKGSDLALRCHMPLNMIPHSVFQVDKDVYFNTNLRLIIRFAHGVNWGFDANEVAQVNSTGAGVAITPVRPDYTGQSALAAAINVTNLRLQLALEATESLVDNVVNQVTNGTGFQLTIPFVHSYSRQFTTAGSNSIIRNYSTIHGQRLRHVYVGVFNNTDSLNTRYMNYNHTSLLWSTIRTNIDSKPLQDFELNVNDSSAYRWIKSKLEGSVITNNLDWNQNCFWLDDFTGTKKMCETKMHAEHSAGLPLRDRPVQYSLEITTTPAATRCYVFAVTEKILSVGRDSITVV